MAHHLSPWESGLPAINTSPLVGKAVAEIEE